MDCWKAKRLKKIQKTKVKCELCGREMGMITPTHFAKFHVGWDSDRYRKTYPDSPMRVFSGDTRLKMSVARKENWNDPEKRKIMTDQLTGRKFSEKACREISERRTGKKINRVKPAWNKDKKMSSEYCQKMSESAVNRKPTTKGYVSAKTGMKVLYRSAWELCYYLHLEYRNDVVDYAVEPFSIKYEAIDGKVRRYVPDVKVVFEDGSIVLVEIKASWALKDPRTLIKIAAGEAYARSQGWCFEVVTEEKFNFDRMLISSLADHFDSSNIYDQKVQRLVAEASRADKATTSARLLSNNQDEDIVRHSGETRRSGIKNPV